MVEILLGALASGLVQIIKSRVKETWLILTIVGLISFLLAGFYTSLVNAGLWESFVQILMAAGATYAFIVRTAEKMLE